MSRALIPNSTQVPDVILDSWMAELSGAEFKVLLYIARRTYGFGKDSDSISLTQIAQGITRRDGTILDRGTGISRASVARALKTLEDLGVILRKTNFSETGREFEENTYSINLDWQPKGGGGVPDEPGPSASGRTDSEHSGVVSKCDYPLSKDAKEVVSKCAYPVAKVNQGWSQNKTRVVSKRYLQETDLQETDQETAAGCETPEAARAAAVQSLVEELVAHGVGRTTAGRLALEKPEVCRRCLEYLPYANIRTNRGAWLANAIRDEYGPPSGYDQAKAREGTSKHCVAQKARQGREDDRRRGKETRLRDVYLRIEESRGEALLAFDEYVVTERSRALRVAAELSPRRKDEFLSSFENLERRLELFERWLQTQHGRAIVATLGPGFLQSHTSNTGAMP